MSTIPTTTPVAPDEFQRFYDRLCHTPLGSLTTLQRRILGRSMRHIIHRASDNQRVYSVIGVETDTTGVHAPIAEVVYTVIATSARHAATVAMKRSSGRGAVLEPREIYEHTNKELALQHWSSWRD